MKGRMTLRFDTKREAANFYLWCHLQQDSLNASIKSEYELLESTSKQKRKQDKKRQRKATKSRQDVDLTQS